MIPRYDYYVYQYLRIDRTPYYIGKGFGNRRFSKDHTIKPPVDKSLIKIVAGGLLECRAHEIEKEMILFFGRKCNKTGILRNITEGGEGVSGLVHSEESKKKMSLRKIGKLLSEEHRTKISYSNAKYWLGKSRSEEDKQKMSGNKKGVPLSEETKAKMSKVRAGRKQELTTCPYCSKQGGNQNMHRYHFDNCKDKK